VDHPVVAGVDGDVIHTPALAGEEHEITRLKAGNWPGQRLACSGLLPGGARQADTVAPEDVLDKTGAVEPDLGPGATIDVPLAEVPVTSGE
jgi:hypothetical protein